MPFSDIEEVKETLESLSRQASEYMKTAHMAEKAWQDWNLDQLKDLGILTEDETNKLLMLKEREPDSPELSHYGQTIMEAIENLKDLSQDAKEMKTHLTDLWDKLGGGILESETKPSLGATMELSDRLLEAANKLAEADTDQAELSESTLELASIDEAPSEVAIDPESLVAQLFSTAKALTVEGEAEMKPIKDAIEEHLKKALEMYFTQDVTMWNKILGDEFLNATSQDEKEKLVKKVNSVIERDLKGVVQLSVDANGYLDIHACSLSEPLKSKSKSKSDKKS